MLPPAAKGKIMSEKLESETPVAAATACSRSDSGETLADIMDILKDLMEDLKQKGGRLREKLMLEKAFRRYEEHRVTLSHGTSPYLGACTCLQGLADCLDCPIHGQRIGNSFANAASLPPGGAEVSEANVEGAKR